METRVAGHVRSRTHNACLHKSRAPPGLMEFCEQKIAFVSVAASCWLIVLKVYWHRATFQAYFAWKRGQHTATAARERERGRALPKTLRAAAKRFSCLCSLEIAPITWNRSQLLLGTLAPWYDNRSGFAGEKSILRRCPRLFPRFPWDLCWRVHGGSIFWWCDWVRFLGRWFFFLCLLICFWIQCCLECRAGKFVIEMNSPCFSTHRERELRYKYDVK